MVLPLALGLTRILHPSLPLILTLPLTSMLHRMFANAREHGRKLVYLEFAVAILVEFLNRPRGMFLRTAVCRAPAVGRRIGRASSCLLAAVLRDPLAHRFKECGKFRGVERVVAILVKLGNDLARMPLRAASAAP
jgi:hypothetical protein